MGGGDERGAKGRVRRPRPVTDGPSEADEAAWTAMLQKPATRSDLLTAMEMMILGQLSQSIASASFIDGDEALQRDLSEKAIDHTQRALKTMRAMLDRWKSE